MFAAPRINTRSTVSGPAYIGARNANRTAQTAYDAELADSAFDRRPLVGKGMGAGSARTAFNRGLKNQSGLAKASSAYANSYMDAVETNRQARLQSDETRAQEASALAGLAQDLSQMDFLEQYGRKVNEQQARKAKAQYSQNMTGTMFGILPLLMGLMD